MDKIKNQETNQVPTRICEIDNEPFLLRFPTIDIWRALHQHTHLFKVPDILKQRCGIWADDNVSKEDIAGQAIVWSTSPIAQTEGAAQAMKDFIWEREENVGTNEFFPWVCCTNERVNFVPMLVPLDRHGLDQSAEFSKENPNGCLIYGGSFCSSISTADDPLPLIDPKTVWTIGDTEGKPLQWMVWNGVLIGTAPIFQMESMNLMRIFTELD